MKSLLLGALATSALLAGANSAFAQSSPAQPPAVDSPNVVVLGRRAPLSAIDAGAALARVPGGVDLVPFEAYEDRLAVSFADTLRLSPGVIADPRFAEEVRLSIRGSGLSRGFHMRGIVLRLDGVPVNLADGAGDFQEIDPLAAARIEVFRGGNGLRYGAASLGGAVNVATRTGRDVDAPFTLRIEGGSFGTARTNLRFGGERGAYDLAGSATYTRADGFRDQLETQSTRVSFNGGVVAGGGETRATLNLNEINQHIPGSLTLAQALATPEMAAPANVAGDQARDIRSTRGSLTHRREIGGLDVEAGVWAFSKSLYHPIFQVVDHDSVDWGAFARVGDEGDGALRRWVVGANFTRGDNDAEQFVNLGGSEGARTFSAEQDAETWEIYGEAELGLSETLSVVLGAQAVRSERTLRRTVPSTLNASRAFEAFNPKLGLLWRPSEAITWYANVSRSFEPPTFSEWVQSGVVQPVEAQSAWTGEAGVRGESGPFVFDLTLYRAQVEDEMLQFTIDSDHPAATFNTDDTIHQGIEAFVEWTALRTEAGALTLAGAYTLNDFRFDGDAQFGDNDLAGAPRHQLHADLAWRSTNGWFVAPNLNWIPEDVVVDYANTARAPGYAVWGLSAGLDLGARARLFLDARNLSDESYIATFSTATRAGPASALYFPGESRAIYAGATLRFGAGH